MSFVEEMLAFFRQEGVPVEWAGPDGLTPFPMLHLPETALLLHCIDLTTYRRFQPETDARAFFQRLSDQHQLEQKRLIHLWEDVWRQKPAVVASRLRALTGRSERIPARLTQARRLDRPTAAQFMDDNHLQNATGSKYRYGLFLPLRYFRVLSDASRAALPSGAADLLVAAATFSHARRWVRNETPHRSVELVRFANRLNTTVVGGIDKLLRAFITEHHPDDLMTYADRDWSDGRSYEKLGFSRTALTEPQQFWLDPATWNRHYPHRLPDAAPGPTCVPVYNAGNIKFVKLLQP